MTNRFAAFVLIVLSGLLLAGVLVFALEQKGLAQRELESALAQHGVNEMVAKGLMGSAVTVNGVEAAIRESRQLTESQVYLALVAAPGTLYLPLMMNPEPTPTPLPTPPPSPDIVEEILIPAGEFRMGCDVNNTAEERCPASQQPVHTVYLDAYFIDKYEVTNTRYAACVEAGGCTPPWQYNSYTRRFYYGNPIYDNYPVIRVDWYQAAAFCAWAGKRLPSEAEWERAARGDSDTRKYPWGNDEPDSTLLNYNANLGDTSEVGSYPDGSSPDGLMDMAGNVWEWINDRYAGDYYEMSPAANPPGPDMGRHRVRRGGSWLNKADDMRVSQRSNKPPEHWLSAIGIRCVRTQ